MCRTCDMSNTIWDGPNCMNGFTSFRNLRAWFMFILSGILLTTTGLLMVSISPHYCQIERKL